MLDELSEHTIGRLAHGQLQRALRVGGLGDYHGQPALARAVEVLDGSPDVTVAELLQSSGVYLVLCGATRRARVNRVHLPAVEAKDLARGVAAFLQAVEAAFILA